MHGWHSRPGMQLLETFGLQQGCLAEEGAADAAEVNAQVPISQSQHHCVAGIDRGTGERYASGVLAAETFGQQCQGAGPTPVGWSNKQARVAHD